MAFYREKNQKQLFKVDSVILYKDEKNTSYVCKF